MARPGFAISAKRLAGMAALLLSLCLPPASAQEPLNLRVIVEGLPKPLLDNATVFLSINQLGEKPAVSEERLRWLHQQAGEEIGRALQPFGYYRPTVQASLERDNGVWIARYQIEPGPPLPIDEVDVQISGEGHDDPRFQEFLNRLPLKHGDTLQHPAYEEIKQTLQRLAAERGYFDAHLQENQIRIDLQTYNADVVVHFDTGIRYRFGQLLFNNSALDPDFLQRYSNIQPDDPYTAEALLQLQSDLIGSEYFDRVEVQASPEQAADHTIPVNVDLGMKERNRYTFGLGYGTDTGVRGSAGLERRWVNQRGHRFDTQLQASELRYGLAARYSIPGPDPVTDAYNIRFSFTEEQSDTKDATTATIGGSYSYRDGPWEKINAIDYFYEDFTFGSEENTSTLLVPSLNWTRISADDRLNTTEGNRIGIELRGAYEDALSDLTFIQAVLRSKWIATFSDANRVILRGDLGTTWLPNDDFDKLPATLRFFAGGDRSVRGYAYESIGPRNADDDVIGGKHLLVGSIEYEHRILEQWSLAAFVDSGDAFDDAAPELRTGVGVGVRWLSPVGPVRVDVASGLDEPGDTVRLHLNIGPDL